MPADREPPTATDYVVTALSPVLVMLMVGSLVFFLVEVLYDGKYSGRLLYTLFFFVAGAVLIARVAIDVDPGRASVYGLLLGAATYAALLTYVEYPGGWLRSFGWLVNLGLLALTWWSAHKLTWDCTHIDERRKGAGRGLLSAAGLSADQESGVGGRESEKPPEQKRRGKKPKHDSRLWDWIGRYQTYREERRKAPHTPGVWVVYFALAALPLFALGQSLVSPDDTARRRATFLQMAVYVGSALGLLVTTSLLGLRRYLRQRRAKIPTALAGGWLALGALFIAVFLVLAAFLPRPHSEVPWFGIARAGSQDRDASKHAVRKGGGAGKGEGVGGDQSKAGDGQAGGKNGQPGGGTVGEKGSGGKAQDGKGGSGGAGEKGGGKGDRDPKGGAGGKGGKEEKKDENGQASPGREPGEESADGDGREESGSQSGTQLAAALEKVAGFLKWVVFAVVAVLVVVAVVLAVLRYLAPFTDWARRLLDGLRAWWAGLWGGRAQGADAPRSPEPAGPVRPPPFHTFSNPFADGSADGRDPAELAAYTFAALDSWAWDRGAGRAPTETPLEFAVRLIERFPDRAEPFARFAEAYAPLAYSDAPPPAGAVPALEEVWDAMVHGVAVG
ncbi:MAG: hypothetical protein C0501_21695 [Isosphaera sp.]|nr:hypothetical protein [Isosphaera sp.]